MAFYDTQGQLVLSTDCAMLHDMNDMLVDSMWNSMLENSIPNTNNFDYPENNYSKSVPYTGVFRASDMNTVMPCSNGVQHVQSSPLSPPVTPETRHDDEDEDCAELDNDCTSCVKCRKTAQQKKAIRREQNRESQRKFRARKEAKLSDAKARIRDLESLVMALEKSNIELRRRIEEVSSAH